MSKLHATWIVLIVLCSLIVIGAVCYLFYRLYINHIYKGQRSWNDISSPLTRTTDQRADPRILSLNPRRSMTPLIQEFLPHPSRRASVDRKMITDLRFAEAPSLKENLNREWDDMETRSSSDYLRRALMCDDLHLGVFSIQALSSETSFHTAKGETSCVGSIDDELSSFGNYCSFTSANESRTSIDRYTRIVDLRQPTTASSPSNTTVTSDKRLLNNNGRGRDLNRSFNLLVVKSSTLSRINPSNNVLPV